ALRRDHLRRRPRSRGRDRRDLRRVPARGHPGHARRVRRAGRQAPGDRGVHQGHRDGACDPLRGRLRGHRAAHGQAEGRPPPGGGAGAVPGAQARHQHGGRLRRLLPRRRDAVHLPALRGHAPGGAM
ncbi:MAG: WhiE I protein of unknown function, partial [uncultured Pseudonocardia sp.]